MLRRFTATFILFTAVLVAAAGTAQARGNPEVAALQVGLRGQGLYRGTVDGVYGPRTDDALRRLQRRAGLAGNGRLDARTRRALGRYGRRAPLGDRVLAAGTRGWDVAALQFALAWHGFPSGPFDGTLGARTDSALRRFQAWAGIAADGVAGPATFAALRVAPARSPLRLSWPVAGPVGDPFGPRAARFHAGVDFLAMTGATVSAAASGQIVYAARGGGGWGKQVVIAHGNGVRTRYAHLSRIEVSVGQRVSVGSTVGLVGATGEATGPHLHFEVLLRGANVDPLTALY